jgi:hypothetical protein
VFQLPGTQNENNATANSAADPSPATIIRTVIRPPSSSLIADISSTYADRCRNSACLYRHTPDHRSARHERCESLVLAREAQRWWRGQAAATWTAWWLASAPQMAPG